MSVPLIALYCLHVVAALFWLGSSFLVALSKGKGAEKQYKLQMGAALLAFMTGGYLWSTLHSGAFGRMETALAVGVVCAIGAAGAQGALVGGSLRRLGKGVLDETTARQRIIKGERIAAGLIAVALLCMVGSYHVGL